MGEVTTDLLSISVSSPSSLYLRALSDWKAIKSLLLGCCQSSPRCNSTPGGPIGIASYFESNDCTLIQIKDGAGASCRASGFLPPRRRRRSVYGTLNLLESSRQVLGADLSCSGSRRASNQTRIAHGERLDGHVEQGCKNGARQAKQGNCYHQRFHLGPRAVRPIPTHQQCT
jgi:hypothetical protein